MKLWQDKEWLRAHYNHRALSMAQCAGLAGCSTKTIQNWLNRFNIPIRHHVRPEWQDAKWLTDRYWTLMMPVKEIAKEAGCSPASIYQVMERLGVPRRDDRGKGSRSLEAEISYRDRDWMYEHYVTKRLSEQEIAEILGRPLQTIQLWMTKLGIERRGHRDYTNRTRSSKQSVLEAGAPMAQAKMRDMEDALRIIQMTVEVLLPGWVELLTGLRPQVDGRSSAYLGVMLGEIGYFADAIQAHEAVYREDGLRWVDRAQLGNREGGRFVSTQVPGLPDLGGDVPHSSPFTLARLPPQLRRAEAPE